MSTLSFPPSSELRVCLLPLFSQFGAPWLPALYSPQIQILVFVCPQFSPSLELGAFPPSVLPQFGLGSFPPPVWSLVLFHPRFSPSLELGAFPLSVLPQFGAQWLPTLHSPGIWSLGVVCSRFSVDLELRGCLPWTQLSGNVPSHMGLLPHPSIPTGTREWEAPETSVFPPRNGSAGTCTGKTHGSVLRLCC